VCSIVTRVFFLFFLQISKLKKRKFDPQKKNFKNTLKKPSTKKKKKSPFFGVKKLQNLSKQIANCNPQAF
jgi:hypothetical protein